MEYFHTAPQVYSGHPRLYVVDLPDTLLTPNDQMPLWPTGAVKLVPKGVGVTDPPCRILASLSVPMGGGTFRSWFVLPVFGWPKLEGAEAAERGEDDPEETDGIGDSPAERAFLLLNHTKSTQDSDSKCSPLYPPNIVSNHNKKVLKPSSPPAFFTLSQNFTKLLFKV